MNSQFQQSLPHEVSEFDDGSSNKTHCQQNLTFSKSSQQQQQSMKSTLTGIRESQRLNIDILHQKIREKSAESDLLRQQTLNKRFSKMGSMTAQKENANDSFSKWSPVVNREAKTRTGSVSNNIMHTRTSSSFPAVSLDDSNYLQETQLRILQEKNTKLQELNALVSQQVVQLQKRESKLAQKCDFLYNTLEKKDNELKEILEIQKQMLLAAFADQLQTLQSAMEAKEIAIENYLRIIQAKDIAFEELKAQFFTYTTNSATGQKPTQLNSTRLEQANEITFQFDTLQQLETLSLRPQQHLLAYQQQQQPQQQQQQLKRPNQFFEDQAQCLYFSKASDFSCAEYFERSINPQFISSKVISEVEALTSQKMGSFTVKSDDSTFCDMNSKTLSSQDQKIPRQTSQQIKFQNKCPQLNIEESQDVKQLGRSNSYSSNLSASKMLFEKKLDSVMSWRETYSNYYGKTPVNQSNISINFTNNHEN